MRDLWLGLTDLYNLFHRRDLTAEIVAAKSGKDAAVAADGYARLLRLRELHRELDQAVLAAYGWDRPTDFGPAIDLRHDFVELDYLPENDRLRYTIHPEARREVLARLLKLNHQRAAAQATTPVKKGARPKQPALQFPTSDLPIFEHVAAGEPLSLLLRVARALRLGPHLRCSATSCFAHGSRRQSGMASAGRRLHIGDATAAALR